MGLLGSLGCLNRKRAGLSGLTGLGEYSLVLQVARAIGRHRIFACDDPEAERVQSCSVESLVKQAHIFPCCAGPETSRWLQLPACPHPPGISRSFRSPPSPVLAPESPHTLIGLDGS